MMLESPLLYYAKKVLKNRKGAFVSSRSGTIINYLCTRSISKYPSWSHYVCNRYVLYINRIGQGWTLKLEK